jgi:hypothetical protein
MFSPLFKNGATNNKMESTRKGEGKGVVDFTITYVLG